MRTHAGASWVFVLLVLMSRASEAQMIQYAFPLSRPDFKSITSIAVDRAGNVYVADFGTHQIVGLTSNGEIFFRAGDGQAGFRGDGKHASEARLKSPQGLAFDAQGNLYFADSGNHRVRKIGVDGIITTVAGNGREGFGGDGGRAVSARLNHPDDVVVDAAGNIYIADRDNDRIRRVSPEGRIETIAGRRHRMSMRELSSIITRNPAPTEAEDGWSGDNGPATDATLSSPWSLALGQDGHLYFAQNFGFIRKVSLDGIITRVAGFYASRAGQDGGDGGLAAEARLSRATITFDSGGNLYFADLDNRRIRRIRSDGIIETVAGGGAVAITSRFSPSALDARLLWPTDVAIDAVGNLYVVDQNRILRVTPLPPAPAIGPEQLARVEVPQLVEPASGAVLDNGCRGGQSVDWAFTWSEVPNVSAYHLYVVFPDGQRASIDDINVRESAFRDHFVGHFADKYVRGWTWKVRARVGTVWSEWSDERSFDLEPPDTDCPADARRPGGF